MHGQRTMFSMAAVFLLLCVQQVSAAQIKTDEMDTARQFVAGRFCNERQSAAQLPFSFTYSGKPSSELLKTWKVSCRSAPLDKQRIQHILTYTDLSTSLRVRCVAVEYLDFPAVEWTVYFKNLGVKDTPILEDVQALNTAITATAKGDFTLYYAEGSHEKITDFQPQQKTLSANTNVRLTPFGGRSSDGYLPFFNVAETSGGTIIGVGWTGQWAAQFSRGNDPVLNVKAGMELTHLTLHRNEEIRTPAILMFFWAGQDRMKGQNMFRGFLLKHYSPHVGDKLVDPPVAFSPHATVRFEGTTIQNTFQGINAVADHNVPVDYWWIDAGWYTCKDNWARWVGNVVPDPNRFPQGLKPVADAAHQKGLKFLLWFEPERVMRDTWLYNNHRDWLLFPPAELPPEVKYMYNDGFHLLNLGNPAALAWAKRHFSQFIKDVGIDAYRNDFNMYPLFYWRNGEPNDRQGMNEIKYITGLY
ncbi:MAG: alpha-galactosidase, partial [Sedimentisphaerales bacterium]|nr:alpha-galactosidase [Sedimentisphaerales bacterium]